MRRRYAGLGLSAVLAISLAVPALGGPGNPVASTAVTAAKALKKAKAAQSAANAAQGTANTALSNANSAQATANAAAASATAANNNATAANNNANTRFNDIIQVDGAYSVNDPSDAKNSSASCPAGDQVTGGGWALDGTQNNELTVVGAGSYGENFGVYAEEGDAVATNWRMLARAYCASK